MAKTFRPYDPDQMLLMPPALGDWVPEDHLARFVRDVVEALDLSAIEDGYAEERWEEIRRLWVTERLPIAEIARRLDLDRKTIRRCLRDTAWQSYHRPARIACGPFTQFLT